MMMKRVKAQRPKAYSAAVEQVITQKRHSGGDVDAFEDMQQILLSDPEGFKNFSQENQAAYHAYQQKQRTYWRPDRTTQQQDALTRTAVEASREAGAGSYIGAEARQSFWDVATNAARGAATLAGGSPDQKAAIEETAIRKKQENLVPDIYQGRNAGAFAGEVAKLNPVLGPLSTAGEMAKSLAAKGVSEQGQRIGAALMGLTSVVGKDGAKLGTREIRDVLSKYYGRNWSKQLLPKDLEVLSDLMIEQGLEKGMEKAVMGTAGMLKDHE